MNDLAKHFIAGASISSITLIGCLLIFGTDKRATDIAIIAAFASAFLAGLLKELYDYRKKGNFDPADLTITWFASVVPILVWGIIQNYI